MAREKVSIDADAATGYAFKDVDDGLALLYLLARPEEFDVLGVTSVYGNASLPRTTLKAKEILRVADRSEVPLYSGAHNRRGLGADTPASIFLREAAAKSPGEVTVLALGPLTNVATAGLGDPDFYANVKRIVVMGGALDEGFGIPLISPLEFNFFKDPVAADMILDAPCDKIMITADLCRQVIFTRRELASLYTMRNRAATYLAYRIEPWLRLNQVAPFLAWKGGFVPWDVVAAVYLRRPELFSEELLEGKKMKSGRLVTGALLPAPEREGRPAMIPTRLEPRQLLCEFLDAIAEFGSAGGSDRQATLD